MYKSQLNKKQAKLRWSDEERRYLFKHCKGIYIEDIAVMLKKSVDSCKKQAQRLMCGYISKNNPNTILN